MKSIFTYIEALALEAGENMAFQVFPEGGPSGTIQY
jgi:hypothetical protein